MSTGQKYSGKGDSTTPQDQNGSNLEPTANQATQAANTPQPETFCFEDMQAFAALPMSDKKILINLHKKGLGLNWPAVEQQPGPFLFADLLLYDSLTKSAQVLACWIHQSGFTPDQLKLALDWLSKTPDSASPSDKVDGMSLQDILGGCPDIPRAQAPAGDAQPVKLTFPAILDKHLTSHGQAQGMINAINKMFSFFLKSKEYSQIEDVHHMLSYDLLQKAFSEMIEQAAIDKLGPFSSVVDHFYQGPIPAFSLGEDAVSQSDILTLNPTEDDDIEHLQDWVYRLQRMAHLQIKMDANHKKMIDIHDQQTASQEKIIAHQQEVINQLKKEQEEKQLKAPVYTSKLAVDFSLNTPHRGTSEAMVLYFAIQEYRDSRRKQYLEDLADDEPSAAYASYQDYETAQQILEGLTMTVIELSEKNYQAARYQNQDEHYRSDARTEKRWFEKQYTTFLASHNRIDPDLEPEQGAGN